jgi:hypothetical protein
MCSRVARHEDGDVPNLHNDLLERVVVLGFNGFDGLLLLDSQQWLLDIDFRATAPSVPAERCQRGTSRRRWRSAPVAWAAFRFTSPPLLFHTRQRPTEMGKIPNRVGGGAGGKGPLAAAACDG